jgi:hypothetical protein
MGIDDSNNASAVSMENLVNGYNPDLNLNPPNLGVDSIDSEPCEGNDRAIVVVPEKQETAVAVVRKKAICYINFKESNFLSFSHFPSFLLISFL